MMRGSLKGRATVKFHLQGLDGPVPILSQFIIIEKRKGHSEQLHVLYMHVLFIRGHGVHMHKLMNKGKKLN